MPKSWAAPGTAMMIREMLRKAPSSSYDVYKSLNAQLKEEGYVPPAYEHVRNMFYVLKRLKLIRQVRKERSKRGFDKVLYGINPLKVDSDQWRNPFWALYRPSDFARARERIPGGWLLTIPRPGRPGRES